MTVRHIILMLEFYLLSLFCVPLPVLCSGNIAGIIVTLALIVVTFYFGGFAGFVTEIFKSGALGTAAVTLLFLIAAAALIYLTVLNVKMLRAEKRRPPAGLPCTVIVLGCRVKNGRPTRMLRRRLEAALEYMNEASYSVCIVSGGQGSDETVSEARAMKEYLIGRGFDESRIYCEDRSTSTFENLKFSLEIIKARGLPENIAIATDGFHQYRAAEMAKDMGADPWSISAQTEPRYALTYRVREWLGLTLLAVKKNGGGDRSRKAMRNH